MRHFVHGPDGQKYGPADFQTLVQWKNEGRITSTTLLEPEVGGTPFEAHGLPGLFDQQYQPYQAVQAPHNYAAYPYGSLEDPSVRKFGLATWILGPVGCACCLFASIAGVVCAFVANSKGHPQGKVLIAYSIGFLVLGIVLSIVSNQIVSEMFKGMGLPMP